MKIFKLLFLIFSNLFLLIIIIYLVFFNGYKDITTGRFHRIANQVFTPHQNLTKIEIYWLDINSPSPQKFYITPNKQNIGIHKSVILKGKDIDTFLTDTWQLQEVSQLGQGLCHEPMYGFKFYTKAKLVLQTSICWKCNNFFITTWGISTWYGINSKTKRAQKLLKFCNNLFNKKEH